MTHITQPFRRKIHPAHFAWTTWAYMNARAGTAYVVESQLSSLRQGILTLGTIFLAVVLSLAGIAADGGDAVKVPESGESLGPDPLADKTGFHDPKAPPAPKNQPVADDPGAGPSPSFLAAMRGPENKPNTPEM